MKYLLLLFFFSGYCQTINYSGNVNENGEPLPGANICILGTGTCTTSDFDGNYTIRVNVGQELVITYIGMQTQHIKITAGSGKPTGQNEVGPILSDDFAGSLKKQNDTLQPTEPSGTMAYSGNTYMFYNVIRIKKDKNDVYSLLSAHDQSKLYLELYTEFLAGIPIREHSFQNRYAQGRSLNGTATYRWPETDEAFSWGPQISSLHIGGNDTPWYPGGDIVPGSGGTPVPVFGANRFFRNSLESKTSLSAKLVTPHAGELKLDVTYRNASGNLPNAKNEDIGTVLSYNRNYKNHRFNGMLNFNRFEDGLSNTNFIHNKAIFANSITPAHFDNEAGRMLPNVTPRNFSRQENNPYYLLGYNRDSSQSTALSLSFSDVYESNHVTNSDRILSQYSDMRTTGGNIPFAARVAVPDYTDRKEKYSLFAVENDFMYEDYGYSKIGGNFSFKYQQRDFFRKYGEGYSSLADYPGVADSAYSLSKTQDRAEANLNVDASHEFRDIIGYDDALDIKFGTDIAISSTYTNTVYGGVSGSFRWNGFIDRNLELYGNATARQYEPGLQNNNLYFNSLAYTLDDFKQMRNHQELFAPNSTTTTREKVYTAGVRYHWPVDIELELYSKQVSDMYAPVNQGGNFSWLPAVDYEQKGLELSASYYHSRGGSGKFKYSHHFNFTTYKNKVTGISRNTSRIPFAGFADVNKNYIVGQPLGAIVGSAYQRDDAGNKIIGDDGFPLVAASPAVIGDPNPDFTIGFGSSVTYEDFTLRVGFDWSHGGDLWNGTAQTLDYYGVSQTTAQQRDVTGYVFKGVTQSGQPNTQPVSFYDTSLPIEQNRWVRYGVGGVAEDAIQDAGYFRLHNISLGYNGRVPYGKDYLGLVVTAFVNNVFIISKSDTAFAGNTLFNSSDTSGLDYFNSPLQRMYGFSVAVKF